MSGLLNLFVVIIVFGLGLWAVDMFLPLPRSIKHLLKLVVIVVLIVFILQFFGLVHTSMPMPMLFK